MEMEAVMTKPVLVTNMKKKASESCLLYHGENSQILISTSHRHGFTTSWTALTVTVARAASRVLVDRPVAVREKPVGVATVPVRVVSLGKHGEIPNEIPSDGTTIGVADSAVLLSSDSTGDTLRAAVPITQKEYRDRAYTASVNYTDRKTCRALYGVVGLPSTPTVSVLEGANPYGSDCARVSRAGL